MYNDGPSLVVAGAGSGKTRVITYKIAYLISMGLKPYHILALTFTNKAAREMKSRIASMVDPDAAQRINMGTFHSIFAKILRVESAAAGLSNDYNIIDADDSKKLIKDIIKEMKLDDKVYKPSLVAGRISRAKNALMEASAYKGSKESNADLSMRIPLTADIYIKYTERLRTSNSVDFDDLLLLTAKLFSNNQEILEKYQNRFQFILVDEYQDTNLAQAYIIQQLAAEHHRVCVVGDDAQSIYAFRGANIDNILQFTRIYPEAKLFKLEQNYRSVKNIVSAANSLIDKNLHQIKKEIYSEKEDGEKVGIIETASDRAEAAMVTTTIRRLKSVANGDWNDFAILYRTNSQSRVLEESFLQYNIPYVIYGGHSFYQRAEIKDVLAYLKLIVNQADEISFSRIVNKPARGIGATTIAKVAETSHLQNVTMFDVASNPLAFNLNVNSGTAKKLVEFTSMIRRYQEMRLNTDAYTLAREVVFGTGIMEAFDADSKEDLENKKENAKELLNGIKQYIEDEREVGNTNADLLDYLNNIALLTDADEDNTENQSRVRLMTVHSAKGLEFKNVFVVGLEESLFPCQSALTDERELEEERRLLYVAITRSMERCTLSYADSRFRNGKMEYSSKSRFLSEIDRKYVYEKGNGAGSFNFSQQDESFFKRRFFKPIPKPISNSISNIEPKVSVQRSSYPVNQPSGGGSVSGLRAGTKIAHERFGTGVVLSIDGVGADARISVDFEYVGRKVLLLKYAKITIISR